MILPAKFLKISNWIWISNLSNVEKITFQRGAVFLCWTTTVPFNHERQTETANG